MLPCVTEAADSNRAINDRRQLLNCCKAVGLFEQSCSSSATVPCAVRSLNDHGADFLSSVRKSCDDGVHLTYLRNSGLRFSLNARTPSLDSPLS